MTNSSALIRLSQISNEVLESRTLSQLKNIVFVLVLINYWSKAYNKVMVGGPVRAFNDLKAYIIKVSSSFFLSLSMQLFNVKKN